METNSSIEGVNGLNYKKQCRWRDAYEREHGTQPLRGLVSAMFDYSTSR